MTVAARSAFPDSADLLRYEDAFQVLVGSPTGTGRTGIAQEGPPAGHALADNYLALALAMAGDTTQAIERFKRHLDQGGLWVMLRSHVRAMAPELEESPAFTALLDDYDAFRDQLRPRD